MKWKRKRESMRTATTISPDITRLRQCGDAVGVSASSHVAQACRRMLYARVLACNPCRINTYATPSHLMILNDLRNR